MSRQKMKVVLSVGSPSRSGLTSSICRIFKVYFFAKVYTFSIKYILFFYLKSILPTSLVARALSNHFVRKSILLRKGSCSRPSLDLAPCRLVVSVSGTTGAPAIIFLFPRVTTAAVLCIMFSKADSAKETQVAKRFRPRLAVPSRPPHVNSRLLRGKRNQRCNFFCSCPTPTVVVPWFQPRYQIQWTTRLKKAQA